MVIREVKPETSGINLTMVTFKNATLTMMKWRINVLGENTLERFLIIWWKGILSIFLHFINSGWPKEGSHPSQSVSYLTHNICVSYLTRFCLLCVYLSSNKSATDRRVGHPIHSRIVSPWYLSCYQMFPLQNVISSAETLVECVFALLRTRRCH